MNSRTRFLETMHFGVTDHVPLFEEGMREGVLEEWRNKGMQPGGDLSALFNYDCREEVSIDTVPKQDYSILVERENGLEIFRQHLMETAEARMPRGWRESVPYWKNREHVLMLMVHDGFFESIGIEDWRTFARSLYLLADYPDFMRQALEALGEFSATLVERFLKQVQIDAAVISEPIGGNHGALVSPRTYKEFAAVSYKPIMDVLKRYGVDTIIWRTYANTRALLGEAVAMGANCLWAIEANHQSMDYLDIRREFGSDLRLIGGIDLDVLRQDEEAIRFEIEAKVPPLLAQGGYIPLADGRVRQGMSYKNYAYYRRLLEDVAGGEFNRSSYG